MKNKHIFSFTKSVHVPSFGLLLSMVLLLSAGCSWSEPYKKPEPLKRPGPTTHAPADQSDPISNDPQTLAVVQHAIGQLGAPYRYGGNNPQGFDCSGLVQYSHFKAGITVPRTTTEQMNYFRTITRSELRKGDLAFFKTGRNQYHVAIMINRSEFVHAPSSGKDVSISNFSNPYWRSKYIKAARL